MRLRIVLALAVSAALLSAPVMAQEDGQATGAACAAMDARLPAELAGWTTKSAVTSAKAADGLKAATVKVGTGYDAALLPTPQVAYLNQPEKPGGSVSHGGLFQFNVDKEGTYRVALGTAGWIDLIEDGKALQAATFGRGPDCTSIRKIVDFKLKPGMHTLQISANASDKLPLMVAAKP
jgi:hypothetical protein